MTNMATTPEISAPWWQRLWRFYADGFRSMTVGRKLWVLIIVKLIIFFAILKVFFFPDYLATHYDNDADRANAVRERLTADE